MRVTFTEKSLVDLYTKPIEKDVMYTDITGMRVCCRQTSNGVRNGVHFKAIFNKNGKRFIFNLGSYPELNLTQARQMFLQKQQDFIMGVITNDTSSVTFGELYEQWQRLKLRNLAPLTRLKYNSAYSQHLVHFEKTPIKQITSDSVMKFIEKRFYAEGKLAMARYVANIIRNILDFAVFKHIIEYNCLARINTYVLKPKVTHYRAFKDETLEEDMIQLFNDISDQDPTLQCMIYMYFFTLLRSNEVRTLKFENIYDDYLICKTKTLDAFKVPLCQDALRVIEYMRINHKSKFNDYVFEGVSADGTVSKNTLNKMLNSKGYKDKLRVHGIRTCGRQWLQLLPTAKESIIELCLSHVVGNSVQQAYNRGDYYEERKRILFEWDNFVRKCIGHNFDFLLL